jgi:MoaA/NifB/PqqE/SkfB family radical SAM enzyme
MLGTSLIFAHSLKQLKDVNKALNNLECLMGEAQMQSVPCHLEIDFSSVCNLRCPMCHQSKYSMGKFRLGEHDLTALIESLPYRESVMIAGLGEPLLYSGLDAFLPLLKRYRCASHLFTNGQLIHRHLHTLRMLDRVSVSFDGACAETFEYLRRGARFATVCANVRALRKAAPHMRLVTSTVLSNRNIAELSALVGLAAELGFDEVHLSPVDHTPALALSADHYPMFVNELTLAKALARQSGIQIFCNVLEHHFRADRNSQISDDDHRLEDEGSTDDGTADEGNAQSCALVAQRESEPTRADLAIVKTALRRLRTALTELRAKAAQNPHSVKQPWCSAPWKYSFARSNSSARLCPYADLNAGSISQVLSSDYNSHLLKTVRTSFSGSEPMLSVCANCTDDHRHFKQAELTAAMHEVRRYL